MTSGGNVGLGVGVGFGVGEGVGSAVKEISGVSGIGVSSISM